MEARSNWGLIEIPDDMGVMNVGGRLGAAGGPLAFRRALFSMKPRWDFRAHLVSERQIAPLTSDITAHHRLAADAIRETHAQTGTSVVIGGGHDHGFSHLLGISEALASDQKTLGCINIDAHLDLRPPIDGHLITSGSPFFLALEARILQGRHLIEFGIQTQCNSPSLWKYAKDKGIAIHTMAQLRNGLAVPAFKKALKKLAARCDVIVISFDLDAVAEAHAPGVSAPQAEGFTPSEILEMLEFAGTVPQVASLGIFELNPEHDIQSRTARLAAHAAYHFLEARLSRRAP